MGCCKRREEGADEAAKQVTAATGDCCKSDCSTATSTPRDEPAACCSPTSVKDKAASLTPTWPFEELASEIIVCCCGVSSVGCDAKVLAQSSEAAAATAALCVNCRGRPCSPPWFA
eukprot:CAMPEP_0176073034 /NCGR_PEP_ID=MMETSP0120_2-20121206/36491_1 /TAXON_ID=160619 /ORGANISM="Kryptoperidinium foliaceum, Strain CCMP 1326" /LENGTH=115 /DNA_ID=CAMNT_0017406715 /DNA_START=149 /DNA_END=493 /DNA_ORIENTATION=-